MPEFTVKEVRLPELHLPEIKRDDIVRSLSGVRLPEVDLARAGRARIKVPTVTLTSSDIGKLVAAGAAIARFVRPAPRRGWLNAPFGRRSRMPVARLIQPRKRRSRWPIAALIAVMGVIGAWALLRRPAVRQRVDAMTDAARERIATMRADDPRAAGSGESGTRQDQPIPSNEAEGFTNATDDTASSTPTVESPDAIGSSATDTDGIPAFEEAGKPA